MSTREKETAMEAVIDINVLPNDCVEEETKKQLVELQLKMATSSINHEYARMEFEDVIDRERREELLDYMHECRCEYFTARSELSVYDPYALADFEADLLRQKQETLSGFQA